MAMKGVVTTEPELVDQGTYNCNDTQDSLYYYI